MNERGQYGTPRVGQFPFTPNPEMYVMNPDYRRLYTPEVPKDFKISDTGAAILLASTVAIVAIGVVGAKRGMKLM
jgi:hypothetical protein